MTPPTTTWRNTMSILSRFMRGALASLALATATFSASAAPTTQLGFLIDASGSIGAANFNIMRAGYVNALNALPTDGSIELTVYTFANDAVQVLSPTVVTAANIGSIATTLNGMAYTAGITATGAGINAIAGAMLGSANYDAGLRSIINIATDGVPNDGSGGAQSQINAVNAAVAAHARGIDAMTAEAIGSVDAEFLRDIVFSPVAGPCANCGVVLADGSTPTNPMTSTPWVLRVNDFNDFDRAITAKVQAIVTTVPEPGSVALVGLALGLVAASRRRKA